MDDELQEPLKPDQAKILIREILLTREFTVSKHCIEEMEADNLTILDCQDALRAGTVRPPDFEKGTWRYRVETNRIMVVIAFRSRTEFVLVTAWRKKS